jgi:hypothetical protein
VTYIADVSGRVNNFEVTNASSPATKELTLQLIENDSINKLVPVTTATAPGETWTIAYNTTTAFGDSASVVAHYKFVGLAGNEPEIVATSDYNLKSGGANATTGSGVGVSKIFLRPGATACPPSSTTALPSPRVRSHRERR